MKDVSKIFDQLDKLPLDERVNQINAIKLELAKHSPFSSEPVDCVIWVKNDSVVANDYNPNSVAPPEMKLLEHSIQEDGYTQPIVSFKRDDIFEVVDGFHRHRVGKESKLVNTRVKGYLPLVVINGNRQDKTDRMASTIRHNRARGKHKIDAMSDIVIELKRRNWADERICRELGMDQDEVLRLCQITGLAEMFKDENFSRSWDAEGEITEADFQDLTDDVTTYGKEAEEFRTVNTGDENRIFHTFENWECHKAGFYESSKEGMTAAQCLEEYRAFLSNIPRFKKALQRVITEWKNSCEHYLTNSSMNRIAWLGQASLCIETGIPSAFRGGFALLTPEEQEKANNTALTYLNKWLVANGREKVTLEEANSTRQSDIY